MPRGKSSKPRAKREVAPKAPKPKHVTIKAGQRLHVHVTKGSKEVAEYIAGADPEGAVRMEIAPEAPAPVADPDPVSGT